MSSPEHKKMKKIRDKSQSIGDFLGWLQGRGVLLARYHQHSILCLDNEAVARCGLTEDSLEPYRYNMQQLLADFFEIDLKKLYEEKDRMLAEQRELNGLGPMARAARHRPDDYDKLTPALQWEIDKRLGILDWDGDSSK